MVEITQMLIAVKKINLLCYLLEFSAHFPSVYLYIDRWTSCSVGVEIHRLIEVGLSWVDACTVNAFKARLDKF